MNLKGASMTGTCASCRKPHIPGTSREWRSLDKGLLICPKCWLQYANEKAPTSRKSVLQDELREIFDTTEKEIT
jgi:hypothetical protein